MAEVLGTPRSAARTLWSQIGAGGLSNEDIRRELIGLYKEAADRNIPLADVWPLAGETPLPPSTPGLRHRGYGDEAQDLRHAMRARDEELERVREELAECRQGKEWVEREAEMRAKEVDSLRRLADEQAERLAYGRSLAAELTAVEDELRMVRNQYLESIAVCDDRDARLKEAEQRAWDAEQRARQAEQRASDADSRAGRLLALEDQLAMQKRLGDAARADADRADQDSRRVCSNEQYQEEAGHLRHRNMQLSQDLDAALAHVKALEAELHAADQEKRDMHRALTALEQNSRGALDTLDAELKARDRELAAKDEQLAGLEADHAGLRADIQAATAQLRDLQDARQRLAGQEAAFAQAQSLAGTVPGLRARVAELEEAVARLEKYRERAEELAGQLRDMHRAQQAAAHEDQAGRQKTAELEQYVRDLETQVTHLMEERMALADEVQALRETNNAALGVLERSDVSLRELGQCTTQCVDYLMKADISDHPAHASLARLAADVASHGKIAEEAVVAMDHQLGQLQAITALLDRRLGQA